MTLFSPLLCHTILWEFSCLYFLVQWRCVQVTFVNKYWLVDIWVSCLHFSQTSCMDQFRCCWLPSKHSKEALVKVHPSGDASHRSSVWMFFSLCCPWSWCAFVWDVENSSVSLHEKHFQLCLPGTSKGETV